MQDPLEVGSVVHDATPFDLLGNAGDPVGSRFGPDAMVRANAWEAHWQTDSHEGGSSVR
jgi:hypothetical protein